MQVISLTADYQVGKKDVFLSIKFGDAQIGSSIVKLAGTEKGSGQIDKLKIGAGPAITGRKLTIKSVVTDVNDKTDKTSVTYTLTGGQKKQTFVSAGTVETNGDSIIYRAIFNLT